MFQATSLDSTTATDVTDSPSTSEQVQVQRLQLQQLRADSGYRSLENPRSSPPPGHRIPSLGHSFDELSEAEEGEG